MEKEELKYEDKVKKLENIINELEAGNIDLGDSIKKYTEAVELVKECDTELKNAEQKITKIVSEDGEEKNFEVED